MSKKWYEEYRERIQAEQADLSREEIATELQNTNEHVFDPETAPKQGHRWVDRGLKYSCENAGHAYHQAWKIKGGAHVA